MPNKMLIDRVFVGVGFYLPLLSFCFFGAIKELPKNAGWMERDAKTKAFMCFILYSTLFPLMVVMVWYRANGRVEISPWHDGLVALAIGQTILYIITTAVKMYYLYLHKKGLDKNTDPYDVMYEVVPALIHKDRVLSIRSLAMWLAFILNVIVVYYGWTII